MPQAAKQKAPRTTWPKEPPVWDLSDLYAGLDDPAIKRDLEAAKATAANFAQSYKGKIAKLSGAELAKAVADYEALTEVLGKLGSFAGLAYAANSADPKIGQFYQNVQEQSVAISTQTLFFELELNALSDKALDEKLKDASLKHFAPWLRDVRAMKPHVLAEDMEKLLYEKSISSRSAWIRLFDETLDDLVFEVDKKRLTLSEVLNLMSDKDGKTRKKAAKEIGKVLKKNRKTFALITNTLAKDKEIEDTWRKYDQPISSRNVANLVEDEVVDALLASVQQNYADLSHRYYKLKAGWFGKDQLAYWHRNAPLPKDEGRTYSWPEAVDIVLEAYHDFSPEFAAIGRKFFENDWIDVPPRKGKSSGAFAHPTIPSAHPYLLLNFQGKLDDIMTLAHELGHGVHQVLAGKQGNLMADTPLTLAETASVFGEQLVFQSLLAKMENPKQRKRLIASKVEDMLNTVVRQVAFCEFERRIHDKRREGELSVDDIGDIWMGVQEESLGDGIKFSKEYRNYWAYIPHFIHTPFYVYAYAFGDCLVNSLYAVYKQGEVADFQTKYMQMLEAGGTLRHKELLAPFGLDASEPDFWQKGLNVISGYIDQLEEME